MARRLLRLFAEMFRIALFVVGGGYAIIAVADEVFSRKLKWLEPGELTDQLPLFQMIPGIMAGHAAVYIGRKTAGFAGSCVALLGVALPSVIIFTLVSMGYDAIPLDNRYLCGAFAGLRAALTGVILAMTWRSARKCFWTGRFEFRALAIFAAAVAALAVGAPVLLVLVAAILLALLREGFQSRAARRFQSSFLAPFIFLKYGAVAFGGGYVLVPMYLQDFVGPAAQYLQIAPAEFANLMSLTQMTPGPIGINAATFFGYRLFGLGGALLTTVSLLIPGFVILNLALRSLERFCANAYVKGVMAGVRPVTVALMAVASHSFFFMSVIVKEAEGYRFHPLAAVLAVLTLAGVLSGRVGVVRLIFLSALIAAIKSV